MATGAFSPPMWTSPPGLRVPKRQPHARRSLSVRPCHSATHTALRVLSLHPPHLTLKGQSSSSRQTEFIHSRACRHHSHQVYRETDGMLDTFHGPQIRSLPNERPDSPPALDVSLHVCACDAREHVRWISSSATRLRAPLARSQVRRRKHVMSFS